MTDLCMMFRHTVDRPACALGIKKYFDIYIYTPFTLYMYVSQILFIVIKTTCCAYCVKEEDKQAAYIPMILMIKSTLCINVFIL